MHDMLLETDRHEERATLTVPPTAAPGKTIVGESSAAQPSPRKPPPRQTDHHGATPSITSPARRGSPRPAVAMQNVAVMDIQSDGEQGRSPVSYQPGRKAV